MLGKITMERCYNEATILQLLINSAHLSSRRTTPTHE